MAEVCDCYWPCLNLHLLLAFSNIILIPNMPANQGFLYCCMKYIPLGLPLDFITHNCQRHALRCLPCRKAVENFYTLTFSPALLSPFYLFLINHAGILNKSHDKTDKTWHMKVFTFHCKGWVIQRGFHAVYYQDNLNFKSLKVRPSRSVNDVVSKDF